MKNILFILLFSGAIQANDLIYNNGFEGHVLISGTASGIVSTGLVLSLQSGKSNVIDETINLDQNGGFAFFQLLKPGDNYTVTISSLPNNPNPQSCQLSNASGTVPNTGVANITVDCQANAWNWDEMNWNDGGWQ